MKRILLAVLLLASMVAVAQEHKIKINNPRFDALKTLAGDWEGKFEGKVGTETYTIVSGNSAIMLDQRMPEEGAGNMITMFHTDGDRLVATHYCAMGNQPRMVSEPSTDMKTFVFKFKDLTNDDGKSGSMRDLTIRLIDKDHHAQDWTWAGADGKTQTVTFEYTRAKSAPAQGK